MMSFGSYNMIFLLFALHQVSNNNKKLFFQKVKPNSLKKKKKKTIDG